MVTDDALTDLRRQVDALRDVVASQTERLERLDAFTESMFSRVERAVRAGLGDQGRGGDASSTHLSDDDRQTLSDILARLTSVEARIAEPPRTRHVALAEDDRATLAELRDQLAALAELREQQHDATADARTERDTLERLTTHVESLVRRPDPEDRLAALERALQRLDERLDQPPDQAKGEALTLTDRDRDLLTLVLSKLAAVEAALPETSASASAPASDDRRGVPPVDPEDIAVIRSQAIEDLADAIERATGGMSRRKVRKLQKGLDRAASSPAGSSSRPVRRPKPAPAAGQRQMVRLEREGQEGHEDQDEQDEQDDPGEPDPS